MHSCNIRIHIVDNELALQHIGTSQKHPSCSSIGDMSLRWLLYQCPCNPGVSVIQNVSQVADFLELERRWFTVRPAGGARGADIFEVTRGAGVIFGGFYLCEDDVAEWTAQRTQSVQQPQIPHVPRISESRLVASICCSTAAAVFA